MELYTLVSEFLNIFFAPLCLMFCILGGLWISVRSTSSSDAINNILLFGAQVGIFYLLAPFLWGYVLYLAGVVL